MARRYYSSTAVETTLSGSISNSATSITVTALSGFPNTTPWTAIIDADTASEELVEVTNVAGTTLTVTRAVDGTAAVSHNAGASFRHGVSARDFDEANDHVNDSTGVHGIGSGSSVVGTTDTQTLTNKTIDVASNTLTGVAPAANPTFTGVASFPDGSASAPSITNTGDTNTGLAFPAADTVIVSTAGTERVRVDATGLVGIATTSPSAQLHITGTFLQQRDSSTNTHVLSAGAAFNRVSMRRASGTNASPTIVSSGDAVGDILWSGYDGTAYQQLALIAAHVDETPGAGDMPGRLGFFTSADGSTSPTERMRIDNAGLITGTGTSLGAWTAYTPTLGGTGWAIGNGTIEGHYARIGKLVAFRVRIILGTTSTAGSGIATVTGPVASSNTNTVAEFQTSYYDLSVTTIYTGVARMDVNSTTIRLRAITSAAGAIGAVATAVPFTWATGDEIYLCGTYEAA